METIKKAIDMITRKYFEEYGKDAKLEDGEEVAAVFNDGVIILSYENKELKVKVLAGEPYVFDYDLNLLEK